MDLLDAIKTAGVVGTCGSGFPMHVKLNTSSECFIMNAVGCEPLVETDMYLCRSYAIKLVKAVGIVASKLGAKRIVIAIKDKYKDEIEALSKAIEKLAMDVEIFYMDASLPVGDEKTVVQQVCNITVPEGSVPRDVGVIVDNVGTVLNIANALNGIPVTEKYLSVVGNMSKNIMVKAPVGTTIAKCIEAAQIEAADYTLIMGGSIMGKILNSDEILSTYVTKTTGNIIVLPKNYYLVHEKEVPIARIRRRTKVECSQCRQCTDLCPRYICGHGIQPHLVMRNFWQEQWIENDLEFEKVFGDTVKCYGCGVCELLSCPIGLSPRRINRYLKGELRKRKVNVDINLKPIISENIELHRIFASRLISRLGLNKYNEKPLKDDFVQIIPDKVYISMKQHVGVSAEPVKSEGERVEMGELLGSAADKSMSANIHASVTGVIVKSSKDFIEIHVDKCVNNSKIV